MNTFHADRCAAPHIDITRVGFFFFFFLTHKDRTNLIMKLADMPSVPTILINGMVQHFCEIDLFFFLSESGLKSSWSKGEVSRAHLKRTFTRCICACF